MGVEVIVTDKGELSLDKAILDHLGVQPGGRVELVLKPNGRVELHTSPQKRSLKDLYGILARENAEPVSLEEMQRAIEAVEL